MFLWSSLKIQFTTGCLPQYYLGKMSNFSFYTFHSLVYSLVVFFCSVCGGFGLVFCCGVFWGFCVWGFIVWLWFFWCLGLSVIWLWGFCACVWVFVVGSDIFDFGCLEFFKSHLVGFNFWFLNTLCLVPPNEAWEVDFEIFFWFWIFFFGLMILTSWKTCEKFKSMLTLLLMQLWAAPFCNGEGFHLNPSQDL